MLLLKPASRGQREGRGGTGEGEATLVCTVNLGPEPVELPAYGELLLSSAPVAADGAAVRIPPDAAAWWTRR